MKKKLFSLLLAFSMVLSFFSYASAQSTDINATAPILFEDAEGNIYVTQVYSEEEFIKEKVKEPDLVLLSQGYTQDEINKMRSLANSRASNSYGNVTYTIQYVSGSFKYTDGTTYLKTKGTWSWSKTPVVNWEDMFGMSTSNNFAKYGTCSASINYYYNGIKTSDNKTTKSATVQSKNNGRATYIKIPMLTDFTQTTNYNRFAMGGSMSVNWKMSGNIKTVGIASNYGHSTVKVTPSISFSFNPFSISFSSSTNYGKEAYTNISR